MSGLEELEDLFEKLDKDGGKYLLFVLVCVCVCVVFCGFFHKFVCLLNIIYKSLFKLVVKRRVFGNFTANQFL